MKQRGFEVCKGYEDKDIRLPIRQTRHSVGYDIESAEDIVIPSLFDTIRNGKDDNVKPILIKTGVKAYFEPDEVMYLYNRSSGPIKKGIVIANSVGVFESDYYSNVSNDGEILICAYNFTNETIKIKKGDRIAQCVFQKFLLTDNDFTEGIRKGGIGSTE